MFCLLEYLVQSCCTANHKIISVRPCYQAQFHETKMSRILYFWWQLHWVTDGQVNPNNLSQVTLQRRQSTLSTAAFAPADVVLLLLLKVHLLTSALRS